MKWASPTIVPSGGEFPNHKRQQAAQGLRLPGHCKIRRRSGRSTQTNTAYEHAMANRQKASTLGQDASGFRPNIRSAFCHQNASGMCKM